MRTIILLLVLFCFQNGYSQSSTAINRTINIRASFLLIPFTPLLTLEVRTIGNLTLQFESNFVNTHGANLKYFIHHRMEDHFVFSGLALVKNKFLRKDTNVTFLPYLGYGHAYRFGQRKQWTFDNRIGIGGTTNADKNGIYPVIKTGLGRVF